MLPWQVRAYLDLWDDECEQRVREVMGLPAKEKQQMAMAVRTVNKVQKTITVDDPRVMLDLSVEEARTLRDVLNHVGGDPNGTRRRHADAINRALGAVNVTPPMEQEGGLVDRIIRYYGRVHQSLDYVGSIPPGV